MPDAPANGNAQQPFMGTNLIPVYIDMINGVSIGPNIRLALGNITGIENEHVWRSVIVITDEMAGALLALLTTQLMQKGVIAQGEAVNEGGRDGEANRKRPN